MWVMVSADETGLCWYMRFLARVVTPDADLAGGGATVGGATVTTAGGGRKAAFFACLFIMDTESVSFLLVETGFLAESSTSVELTLSAAANFDFLMRVLGVCGVSNKRSLRNFLCGGVRLVLPPNFIKEL